MKLNKVFLFGAIALGLLACNKSTPDVEPKLEGTTFASMQISTKLATRALDHEQNDHAGTASENALENLQMISTLSPSMTWKSGAEDKVGEFWKVGTDYKTAPTKVSPGMQTFALIINPNTDVAVGVATETKEHLYNGVLANLIKPGEFVMTSAAFTKKIEDNISFDENKGGETEALNVFKGINIERVVAKGIVRMGKDFTNEVKRGSTVIGTVDDLKFVAVNGATKTLLYADKAGERTMTEADNNLYAGFESAIHTIEPKGLAADAKTAGLVRLGDVDTPADVHTPKAVNDIGKKVDEANAFYFMENSGDLTKVKNAKSQGFYRYAYAKVYVKYVPKELLGLDTEGNLAPVTATTEDKGTFYKGAVDGLLYTTKEAAKNSVVAKDQAAYTYKEGKCGYRALWNRQTGDASKGKVVVNADTRRNNIYMLDIKDFAGLGFPWDPSDPNDPNLPHPGDDDPTEPKVDPTPGKGPDDPNIEDSETYMRVEAQILKWNLVERRDITLK